MIKCPFSGAFQPERLLLALTAFMLPLLIATACRAVENVNHGSQDVDKSAEPIVESGPERLKALTSNATNETSADSESNVVNPISDVTRSAFAGPPNAKENTNDAKNADTPKDDPNKTDPKDTTAEPDILVGPPAPTPEEAARRKEKAAGYQSLAEKTFNFPVTGTFVTRYRFRHGVGDTAQDFSEFATVDIGDKTRQIASAHIDVQAYEGLDRHHTPSSDIFTTLLDTYDKQLVARLYSAYVDFNRLSGIDDLRVGRQFDFDTPEIIQYDGVRLDTTSLSKLENLTLCFYGGVPVHEYEKSNQGDWLAGMAAEVKPWEHSRIRFDYIHVNDSFSDWVTNSKDPLDKSLSPIGGTRTNDLASVSFWQAFKNPNIHLNGHFSIIDSEARDFNVRAVYNNTSSRLQVYGSYSAWFKPDTQFVTEFDPYYETLKGQEPYQNGSVRVSKGFLEWLWLDAGADSRRLINNGKTKEFNREFDRCYATLQTRDILKKGLSISATATHWEGKDGAPTTTQFGGEVDYKWNKKLETIAGTDYVLYKYDLFQNTEHDQDRTYFFRQRWNPTRWSHVDARYEFEHSRSQDFHTFTMQFRFDF